MDDEFSVLNLKQDFEEVLSFDEAHERWALSQSAPLEILATMYSIKNPVEKFQARLLWLTYPESPPSLKFRDLATGRLDMPTAWPKLPGFRPQSLDACANWCSEGFVLHQEWKNDPNVRWDDSGNPLLKVLRTLQKQLDEKFEGRFQ